jgi:hypothetical protein
LRGEDLVENDAALLEPIALVTGETVERIACLRCAVTAHRPDQPCEEGYGSKRLG